MSAQPRARPAIGHMPFPGHRTVAAIWARQEAARQRAIAATGQQARAYGFDPNSLLEVGARRA
jgi:hypothetical protein